jgi:hypothetical protein
MDQLECARMEALLESPPVHETNGHAEIIVKPKEKPTFKLAGQNVLMHTASLAQKIERLLHSRSKDVSDEQDAETIEVSHLRGAVREIDMEDLLEELLDEVLDEAQQKADARAAEDMALSSESTPS